MPATRALILVRLSRVTEATTSPQRQEEACREYCTREGMTVVDVARDEDVSGSTDPLDRPSLGPWLRDRLSEFDVVVASKLDRVGRNARHVSALIDYLSDRGKSLRWLENYVDTSTSMGRMIVTMMSTVAEMELDEIRSRNTGAAQYNIRSGKYRGGLTPAGYQKVKVEKGYRLVPDEEGLAPVIRDIVRRVIEGERIAGIVADLNARGVQTHRDRQAELNGHSSVGHRWSVSNLGRILRAPSLAGYVTHREPITDENGKQKEVKGAKQWGPEQTLRENGVPVMATDTPLISEDDYSNLHRVLENRAKYTPNQRRPVETSLLTQVVFCPCGHPMWTLRGARGRKDRYRCGSKQRTGTGCEFGSVTMDDAENVVTFSILTTLGQLKRMRRVLIAGADNTNRIAEMDRQLESMFAAVQYVSPNSPAHARAISNMEALSAERDRLASTPVTDDTYRYEPTGQTFAEYWEGLSTTEKNDLLRSNQVTLTASRERGLHVLLGDLPALVESVDPSMDGQAFADVVRKGP